MIKYLLLLGLLAIPFDCAYPFWSHRVINYSKGIYNFKPQNWDIDQSQNGWMYFANDGGLLEFDGINWCNYAVPNNVLRSIKCKSERIYVGGSSEFGYYIPNKKGGLSYTSLSDSLPGWGGEVWNILFDESTVYFQSDKSITSFKNNRLTDISTEFKIESSTIIGKTLYCGTNQGLYYLDNGKLIFINETNILKGKRIISIFDLKDDKILLVTREGGIYIYDGRKVYDSTVSSLDFVKHNQFFSASLCDSILALGTIQHGVYIVDMKTLSYQNYSLDNQLQNNTVLNLKFDKEKNLWLALDNGIDYLNLSSSVLSLYGNKALIGSGYGSTIVDNTMYMATNQGVYTMSMSGSPLAALAKVMDESKGQSWGFLRHDNATFVATDKAIWVIDKGKTTKINVSDCWQLCESKKDKDILFAVLYSGIAVLRKNGSQWQYSHQMETKDSFLGMMADEDENIFWCMSEKYGISKFTISSDLKQIVYLKHYKSGKDIGENKYPRKINGQLVFCLKDGIVVYNKLTDGFNSHLELQDRLDGGQYYRFLLQDAYNNIWYVGKDNLKMLRNDTIGNFNAMPYDFGLKNMLNYSFLNISEVDKHHVVVNTYDGFVLLDLNQQDAARKEIAPYIRFITCLAPSQKGIEEISLSTNDTILNYSTNSLRFDLGATDYTHEMELMYVYRLKGFQDSWSLPSINNTKEYTALPEGRYVLEVKLVANGVLCPDMASFGFRIMPPWYRSNYAYIAYSLMLILLLLLLYKITIKKQTIIINQKKKELIEQKKKHQEETTIKDKEIDTLQHEKLIAELEFKNQELTGSTLNVIRKNEILLNIKKSVLNLAKSIDESLDSKHLKRKTLQLLSQIETNMEHDRDFDKFFNTFDQLHQDFFKKLEQNYPNLTKNDKLLCAYTKMNLSSKEIAPLLNISVRGVDIARYRLRKKMNLDRSDNLPDILQKII